MVVDYSQFNVFDADGGTTPDFPPLQPGDLVVTAATPGWSLVLTGMQSGRA